MKARVKRGHGRRWPLAGFVLGAVAGAAALTVNSVGAAREAGPTPQPPIVELGLREVLHTPPLLVEQGERVRLSYDVVCQADTFGKPCALEGDLFVRPAGNSGFAELPLVEAGESSLAAVVPTRLAEGGFEYYAVVESGSGETATIPEGGVTAPHRAWIVPRITAVQLGTHRFGRARRADKVVAHGDWGTAGLGLISGRDQATIGPSAFDIGPDGSVVVLDQLNQRLAVFSAGSAPPRFVPIPFSGAEGDVAVGNDGAVYVLDQGGPGAEPVLRAVTPAGDAAGTVRLAGRGADMVRTGPGGALVHAYPGDIWLPVGETGRLLDPSTQAVAAHAGRSIGGGVEIIAHGSPAEALFALVRGDRVVHAWRVASATGLGEIQLVEPFGAGVLAVVRVWDKAKAEFVVLALTPAGLADAFAVDAVEWAESAALGRFRLRDATLYQLRSAPAGADIVTFRIGGSR